MAISARTFLWAGRMPIAHPSLHPSLSTTLHPTLRIPQMPFLPTLGSRRCLIQRIGGKGRDGVGAAPLGTGDFSTCTVQLGTHCRSSLSPRRPDDLTLESVGNPALGGASRLAEECEYATARKGSREKSGGGRRGRRNIFRKVGGKRQDQWHRRYFVGLHSFERNAMLKTCTLGGAETPGVHQMHACPHPPSPGTGTEWN